MSDQFTTLVVGKGLMGSAAFRYLAAAEGSGVGIVGPDEPIDPHAYDGPFASHWDEGRLTFTVSKDITWSRLTAESVAQYPALQARSGIAFHVPCGTVGVAPHDGLPRLPANYAEIARAMGVPLTIYANAAEITAAHPLLRFDESDYGLWEPPPAGYINPRALIRAQLTCGQADGGQVVPEAVVGLTSRAAGVEVQTAGGRRLSAERVLVATGASVNLFGLLPRPLALRVKGEMTVLARVSEREAARLAAMPVVRYAIRSPWIDGIYMTPPARYPDGGLWIKLGCDTVDDVMLPDAGAMRDWVISGNGDRAAPAMRDAICSIIRDLAVEAWQTRRCIVCYTPHRKPYIDWLTDDHRLAVLTGGNGGSAKCSDALGQLGARLLLGEPWPAHYARPAFRAIYADEGSEAALFGPSHHISPACRVAAV